MVSENVSRQIVFRITGVAKMCIYLGNCEDLTYQKQEHVFPAGLGGKRMLDHGVVSDQANNLFSPMELKLM